MPQPTCHIPNCPTPPAPKRRGLCEAHYAREGKCRRTHPTGCNCWQTKPMHRWGTSTRTNKPPRGTINCDICGDTFTPTNSATSCNQCLTRYTKDQRRKLKAPPRQCAICGTTYRNSKKRTQTCGQPECAKTHARNQQFIQQRTCTTCGTTYTGHTRSKYCTDQCRPQTETWQPQPTPCHHCGTTYTPTRPSSKYCTAACRLDTHLHRAGIARKELYAAYLKAIKTGEVQRATAWIRELTRYIAERDGTTCGICGTPIRMHYKSGTTGHPSGLGPSVDHIIPRSEQPELASELANLRLAHWKCNRSRRTTTTGTEQLAIIG